MLKSFCSRIVLFAVIAFSLMSLAGAQPSSPITADDAFVLTADKLHSAWEGDLGKAVWRYHAGDDARWAARGFDDSDWEKLADTQFNVTRLPSGGWTGIGWFRLHITADERLADESVALRLWHWGASEIYVDGKLLERFGTVDANDGEVEHPPRGMPVPLTFATSGEHVIAVRHSFAVTNNMSGIMGAWFARTSWFVPGFSIYIQTARGAITDNAENTRDAGSYKLFAGILYAFALLHFLLFVFYRRERKNLFYSLFAFCLASGSMFSNIVNNTSQTVLASIIIFTLFAFGIAAAFLALQAFLYEVFAPRFSKFFWLTCVLFAGQAIALIIFVRSYITLYMTSAFVIISLVDSFRLVVMAVVRRRDGAWIIAGGVMVIAVGILVLIARELQVIEVRSWSDNVSDYALNLGVPVAVSVYLARNFARTNKNLAAQLAQVNTLSAQQLEHERTAAELRLQHEKERAENERRAQELEEARQLQLSMLPKTVPQLPNLEIAAYMKPATEVGGDYYDFHLADDGTLTVVIGDATGHGLKAGTVVTATKSLFNNLADEPDITGIFKQIARSLKLMNLRGLFMAMTMVKIKNNALSIGVAGMPSALIHRHATNTIDEVATRAVPLGSLTNFPYKQQELTLQTGDTMILMSDGFPEMFNDKMEMLGYEAAEATLRAHAHLSAQGIINRFVETGEAWAQGRAQDDDVTFVVLKVKGD